ncbi:hypothetical protein MRX96_059315 [Rhipicephalus microplus]
MCAAVTISFNSLLFLKRCSQPDGKRTLTGPDEGARFLRDVPLEIHFVFRSGDERCPFVPGNGRRLLHLIVSSGSRVLCYAAKRNRPRLASRGELGPVLLFVAHSTAVV